MGTLYVVGTPIGNLEDITLRAIRILREVGLIAAEDTRRAHTLLTRYEIKTPLVSYFEHSGPQKRRQILDVLKDQDVALISEAGMPGISDPGYDLIRESLQEDIPVVPIPGPSALISALVVSGLPTDSFVYVGFLPRKAGERQKTLQSLKDEERTIVLYETPHRLRACLQDMLDILGDRPLAIARELTKIHEEVLRRNISELLIHFQEIQPRGEFTLVVQGAGKTQPHHYDLETALALARELMAEGLSAREAAAEGAKRTGLARRAIYDGLHSR